VLQPGVAASKKRWIMSNAAQSPWAQKAKKTLPLPVWGVGALLALGVVSAIFPIAGLKFAWTALWGANVALYFSTFKETVRDVTEALYRARGGTPTAGQLKAEATKLAVGSVSAPYWYIGMLLVGVLPVFFWLVGVVGTLITGLIVLAVLSGLGFLVYQGFRSRRS
jgi:hypothetical protein